MSAAAFITKQNIYSVDIKIKIYKHSVSGIRVRGINVNEHSHKDNFIYITLFSQYTLFQNDFKENHDVHV